jgi:hypothetical protein
MYFSFMNDALPSHLPGFIYSNIIRIRDFFAQFLLGSRDSSVGIALGYGLDDRGSRVRFPARLETFLFSTASRTDLGPIQLPIQWVPGALSLGVKWPGREADHSPPASAEVNE